MTFLRKAYVKLLCLNRRRHALLLCCYALTHNIVTLRTVSIKFYYDVTMASERSFIAINRKNGIFVNYCKISPKIIGKKWILPFKIKCTRPTMTTRLYLYHSIKYIYIEEGKTRTFFSSARRFFIWCKQRNLRPLSVKDGFSFLWPRGCLRTRTLVRRENIIAVYRQIICTIQKRSFPDKIWEKVNLRIKAIVTMETAHCFLTILDCLTKEN